jgi:iron complex outermembrane receptor protein
VVRPLSLYFSYARGFRLPNFDEDLPLLGAVPDLEPQESNAYELGAKLESGRVGAGVALYRMDVEDEVIFDPFVVPPGAFFPGANQNFDEVQHQGVELSLDATAIEGWLQVYGSYTFDDVEIQEHRATPAFEGKEMPMIPRHRGTLGVQVLLPYGFEVAANGNIVGSRYPSNDFANAGPQLDTYGTADFFFTWRPRLGGHLEGFLTFAIRNATDEEYESFGADFSGPGFTVPQVFYPAPGRSYDARFMLRYRP